MDIQLQDLIDRIKKDGIASASDEAAKLQSQAEAEANRTVETAKKEASAIIAKAKADAERTERAGNAALEQASRNLALAFKGEIQNLLDAIVKQEVTESYKADTLKTVLPDILKTWAANGSDDLAVLVSEKDLKNVKGFFDEKLADTLKKGIELKSDRNLSAGFRIAEKDGSAYYDFSAESAAELFGAYLNSHLAEIFKAAVKAEPTAGGQ
ncbi:MAG: V-type ATP synthase subunit E [Treponema sp.]|jgi:V/A-type H+-transporting ATPase subunit E|nr:V-type ATP synthase subunit E [Treponema sp.]